MGESSKKQTSVADKSERQWWQSDLSTNGRPKPPHAGQPCPKCLLADLDLDTLFRLSCPNCGYVADCGAFT